MLPNNIFADFPKPHVSSFNELLYSALKAADHKDTSTFGPVHVPGCDQSLNQTLNNMHLYSK